MYLPIVNAEVGHSVAEGLEEECDQDEIAAWKIELKKIKKQNPVISEFIWEWSKQAHGKSAKLHSLICGICLYKLLESQAEADQMSRDIKVK